MYTKIRANSLTTSGQRILTKSRIACRAIIECWRIPFAAYTAAETPNAFQWADNTKQIVPSREGSRPLLFLRRTQVSPQTVSRSV